MGDARRQMPEMAGVRLAVLGPLEAARGSTVVTRPSHRRLLAVLVQAGEPLDLEQLADRFWPDEQPTGWKATLQTHVSALRRLLGSNIIVHRGGRYALGVDELDLDLPRFQAWTDSARAAAEAGQWQDVVRAADNALQLWRGDPFPELADDPFAMADIVQLRERLVEVGERRAEALLQLGRHEEALPDLEALTLDHPLRERLSELLMTARARCGRTAEALDAYRELRARMVELGLEPNARLRDLEGRILREDPTVVGRPVRHNLPAIRTSFVGRAQEVRELSGLLRRHRLMTLTGAGGVGKSRLAQLLAREHLDDFPDGVHLVELAAVTEPAVAASTTALAFGLRVAADPLDALRGALRHRAALCILDNCEHLLDTAGEIADVILSSGPAMHVLATSRAPLGLPDEVRFNVPPLSVPADDATDDDIIASDAGRLLLERAHLPVDGPSVPGDGLAALGQLCRRLDGLPLAIELAAARLDSISAAVMVERIGYNLALLSAEGAGRADRHRGLEATFAWSYELLTEAQRTLFARLAVFRGSFTMEAAESVCQDDDLPDHEVAAALIGLVERSMVTTQRTPTGIRRYWLLETMRTFAGDRLAQRRPGMEHFKRRHLAWAASVAAEVVADLDRADQFAVLERLQADSADLTAAHDLAEQVGDRDATMVLAIALAWFWSKRGHHGRATAYLEEAIDRVDETAEPERAADVRARLAGIHYSAGRERDAMREATHARDLLAAALPSPAKVRALSEHASIHMRIVQRDPDVAIESAKGAIEAARAIGDRFAEAHALRTLGTALGRSGDLEEGVACLRDALATAWELNHPSELLGAYLSLFIMLLELTEQHDEAMRVADDATAWLNRGGERLAGSSSLLMWIAYGALKSGRVEASTTALERSARYHLEGALRMSYLAIRALQHWTAGRWSDALADARRLREIPVSPRYYRILYPLEAEVAAATGQPDDVHALVRRHLAEDVLDIEQPLKCGTLWPAVRVEVEAAVNAGTASARHDHLARAEAAVSRMRQLMERYPPSPPSGLRFEMPQTYLALSEAECSRATGPDPAAWQRAVDLASYLYWRTYARMRLAEALLTAGARSDGEAELVAARDAAMQLRAPILVTAIEDIAAASGIAPGPMVSSTG